MAVLPCHGPPIHVSIRTVISLALEVVRIRMLSPHAQISVESIQTYKDRIQRFERWPAELRGEIRRMQF
jgi:hypothetical protein